MVSYPEKILNFITSIQTSKRGLLSIIFLAIPSFLEYIGAIPRMKNITLIFLSLATSCLPGLARIYFNRVWSFSKEKFELTDVYWTFFKRINLEQRKLYENYFYERPNGISRFNISNLEENKHHLEVLKLLDIIFYREDTGLPGGCDKFHKNDASGLAMNLDRKIKKDKLREALKKDKKKR